MIVRADIGHAAYVGFHMRQEVALEADALGVDKVQASILSFENSVEAWAWIKEDRPAAMWGVGVDSVIGGKGVPWLITTDIVNRHGIEFAKGSRQVLSLLKRAYPVMENYVDARYTNCVRWLRWLGFQIEAAAPYGARGLPFHKFRMG